MVSKLFNNLHNFSYYYKTYFSSYDVKSSSITHHRWDSLEYYSQACIDEWIKGIIDASATKEPRDLRWNSFEYDPKHVLMNGLKEQLIHLAQRSQEIVYNRRKNKTCDTTTFDWCTSHQQIDVNCKGLYIF